MPNAQVLTLAAFAPLAALPAPPWWESSWTAVVVQQADSLHWESQDRAGQAAHLQGCPHSYAAHCSGGAAREGRDGASRALSAQYQGARVALAAAVTAAAALEADVLAAAAAAVAALPEAPPASSDSAALQHVTVVMS